jgi:hypothetical protein
VNQQPSNKKFVIGVVALIAVAAIGIFGVNKLTAKAEVGKPDTIGTCWHETGTQMEPVSCDADDAKYKTTKKVDEYHGCTDIYVQADEPKKYLCLDPIK